MVRVRGRRAAAVVALIVAGSAETAQAFSGAEGASFMEIPVGGRPAAMGGAYSALADDAYAPVWNPAGLGRLPNTQLSLMHLAYVESINYEYVSFAHPLTAGDGLGASVQYLHPKAAQALDQNGNGIGTVRHGL